MSHWYSKDRHGRVSLFDTEKPGHQIDDDVLLSAGLYPSVTTILQYVGNKDGLMYWIGNLGIMTGMKAGEERWSADTARDYLQQLRDYPSSRGTAIHKAIELFLSEGVVSEDPVMGRACNEVSKLGLDGENEHVGAWVADGIRYAGTVDHLHSGGVDDFKTTTKARDSFPSEVAQIAAYIVGEHGLENLAKRRGRNIYILQGTGEIYRVTTWMPEQLLWGWEYFRSAYRAWRMGVEWKRMCSL